MFETNEDNLSDAARAALDALRQCSLTELHAIRLHFLGVIQRDAGRRAIAAAQAKILAERAAVADTAHVVEGAIVPDAFVNPHQGPWPESAGPVS